ncbi:RagB/SusD family nutrient uptake outer membrane protein [Sphingobacterium sp. UDSM-2020]|uniref:RagB/SusD family nutrient uptake outer membrane protein n=1 Tax=Sphingobacterium sp. UDSM-2020 TaxID=2795738 RepID=UPI0019370021|nr:RagB/SusD family nutrient uptake outer membrane protein [Sphingobacterium sp. UDSM-2020]QQD13235.1 RagB/SusD family nutrient uptake outer membrane protein [Sphingobacterium sp. UDSM-2020]
MKKYISILTLSAGLLFQACTKLDQEFYSSVTPETFYKSEKDIKAALFRPFTHAKWYIGEDRWRLQEYTADNFAITTKGRHWYNGGENERYHYHKWTADDGWIWGTWRGTLMGVALALDTKNDLSKLDYTKFALSADQQQADMAQLDALISYFYLRGLDYFGGMPIFESLEQESLPRNTDQELFLHIEKLLKAALNNLPAKKPGDKEEGAIRKAAVAAMLAQLYFNAEAYIGKPMYEESRQLSQALINKEYGDYQLDPTWNGVHGFKNNNSPEIIWSMPSEFKMLEYNWFYADFYHYNTREYFSQDMGGNNGAHLTPSRKPDGTLYSSDFKLGSPFETFSAGDFRKSPYRYLGTENYEGMFIVGPHLSPDGKAILGGEEYNKQPLNFVDQVARFSEVGQGKKYSSVAQLPSKMSEGEENTGIRLVKVPIPNLANNTLRWGADMPVIRLAEIYYMLAECEFRVGDKTKAVSLINDVRKRNFTENIDLNPVTTANIDKYRFLDEWSIEFIGEGRRRTDLIRWKAFTTENWWDHSPSNSSHLNRFPIPNQAIAGNNMLEQNPGY